MFNKHENLQNFKKSPNLSPMKIFPEMKWENLDLQLNFYIWQHFWLIFILISDDFYQIIELNQTTIAGYMKF